MRTNCSFLAGMVGAIGFAAPFTAAAQERESATSRVTPIASPTPNPTCVVEGTKKTYTAWGINTTRAISPGETIDRKYWVHAWVIIRLQNRLRAEAEYRRHVILRINGKLYPSGTVPEQVFKLQPAGKDSIRISISELPDSWLHYAVNKVEVYGNVMPAVTESNQMSSKCSLEFSY